MPALRTYIVEDSPVIRENLVAALEEMTPVSVVGTAEDEATAREWLESGERECDLVIIDIFLRKGSGLGVLQGLAQTPRDCKRVVLSNFATPDMRRKCLELGAHKVFDKSNEIDALIGYCLRLSEGGGETEPGALQEPS
jgi:DNA-binding NarL/FixJ family response regulator